MTAAIDRRDFVSRLPVVTTGLLVGAGALALASCAGVPYLTPRGVGGRLLVPAAQVRGGSGVFVTVPGGEHPIYLHRAREGELVALLARCTHRGCQPEPVADRLVCPCHGSEYDLWGAVLEGPAERPLTRYEVTTEGDDAVIWLRGRGL